MTKVYIDIDGVLLTKKMTLPEDGAMLIDYLLENFDCLWLTTHCRGGENKTLSYLRQFYTPELIKKLERINPTDWSTLKTEAIDMSSDFIWLEDYPMEAEKLILRRNNKSDSLIQVDLNRPDELKRVKQRLVRFKTL
ncbi:MAG: hypothetical protein HEP71_26435 [Roseivirga sp.]|nr:hypothetical protein [Roseivirga sp.]